MALFFHMYSIFLNVNNLTCKCLYFICLSVLQIDFRENTQNVDQVLILTGTVFSSLSRIWMEMDAEGRRVKRFTSHQGHHY